MTSPSGARRRPRERRGGLRAAARICRHRPLVAGVVLASLGMAVISAAFPVAVSRALAADARADRRTVYLLAASVLAIGIVVWVINRVRAYLARRLVARTVLDLRLELIRAALRGRLDFYDRYPRSTVLSRATDDLDEFGEAVFGLLELAQQLLVIALLLPLMLVLDWRLTLLTAVCGGLIMVLTRAFRRITSPAAGRAAADAGTLASVVHEVTAGLRVVRAYGGQDLLSGWADRTSRAAARSWMASAGRAALLMPAVSALVGLALAGAVWGGGLLIGAGLLGVSAWYLFVLAADRISWTLASAGAVETQLRQAAAAATRIFAILDAVPPPDPDPLDAPASAPVPVPRWAERPAHPPVAQPAGGGRPVELCLRAVSLRYHNGTEALRNVSLQLPAGARVGLVGRSGAGKSSLLKAIAGLHRLDGGEVSVGGLPLDRWPEPSLRRTVGYVPQRPQLFAGTVADNLRLSRPDVTDRDLTQLIVRCQLDGWLAGLPQGLETVLGHGGSGLSAGQRQVVTILRALVKQPGLVLLDEPTAHLDAVADAHLRTAMWSLLRGATVVMIAHRLDTVRDLDQLVVLDQGRIVETGTPGELLDRQGWYAAMHADHVEGPAHVS
ncbi:ABC transporter ATP-binding protein [Micromonospora sp. NPDC050495]|uniref:ABC transporter ATP-binding protein n=1 Tax=Micromonospora sp. NPDC050495 TaxID=3154936 RepID=UPI0033FD00E7